MNARELLAFLVATPSVSGEEAALSDAFSARLADTGFEVARCGNNLWFSLGEGAPRLLLNSHLDTVPPAVGWRRDPFAAVWRDERLYGLGANDAKGCVAAMTAAAVTLRDRPLAGTAVFAFTAEEETGGAGLATVLDRIGPFDAAVVGEPTGLAACTTQRGMLLLRCTARGRAGHSAHAKPADNAIHVAAGDIALLELLSLAGDSEFGAATAQVTGISGGVKRNQVPETCEFFVDIRTTPQIDHERLVARLRHRLRSDVAVHSGRYVPKATPADAPIVQAALAAGAGGPVASATTSDWAFLGAVPAVKIGPGDTVRSHCADEYLAADELEAGVHFYARLVAEFFAARAHG